VCCCSTPMRQRHGRYPCARVEGDSPGSTEFLGRLDDSRVSCEYTLGRFHRAAVLAMLCEKLV